MGQLAVALELFHLDGAFLQPVNLGEDAVLEDCTVAGVTDYGVHLSGARATVRRCVIESNGLRGVSVGPSAHGVLIEDSVIKANNTSVGGGAGIVLFANQATVRDNDMSFNLEADIRVFFADNVIVDNIVSCPTSIVVDAGASNTFAPVNTTDPHTNRAHKTVC